MTGESPEILQDGDGKWIRRDVLEKQVAEEWGDDPEEVTASIEEMIEDGGLREKEVGETPYVQLASRWEAVKTFMRAYTEGAGHRINSMLGRE